MLGYSFKSIEATLLYVLIVAVAKAEKTTESGRYSRTHFKHLQ